MAETFFPKIMSATSDVHPNEDTQRTHKLFRVWLGTRNRIDVLVVHCHDVAYQGSFAVFWIVDEGLRQTVWATNKDLDIREVPGKYHVNAPFGVYEYPTWRPYLENEAYG